MARALYVCRARRGFLCVWEGGLCDIGSLCVMAEACVAGTVRQGLEMSAGGSLRAGTPLQRLPHVVVSSLPVKLIDSS